MKHSAEKRGYEDEMLCVCVCARARYGTCLNFGIFRAFTPETVSFAIRARNAHLRVVWRYATNWPCTCGCRIVCANCLFLHGPAVSTKVKRFQLHLALHRVSSSWIRFWSILAERMLLRSFRIIMKVWCIFDDFPILMLFSGDKSLSNVKMLPCIFDQVWYF